MKNLLITGAAGFIGSNLIEALSTRDLEIIGVDNINEYGTDVQLKHNRLSWLGVCNSQDLRIGDQRRSTKFPNFTFMRLSIEESQRIKELFETNSFDVVIHLAAQAGVRSIVPKEVYYQSNIVGFQNILEVCRLYHIQKFIFASSSSVYGNDCPTPQRENFISKSPTSFYAETKIKNEEMAYKYATTYGLPCIGLRFFSVYGPWGRPDMLPMLVANHILKNHPLQIFNKGLNKRDFTYIDDIIEGICRALDYSLSFQDIPYKIYNIGRGCPISTLAFMQTMEQILDKKATPTFLEKNTKEDVKQTHANTTLLKKDLGICPQWTLERGLQQFVNWYKGYYMHPQGEQNEHKPFIACLVTTKNRQSFYNALLSVKEQKRQPDCIIVVSDSNEEDSLHEKEEVEKIGGIYLRAGSRNHEHNYAGSLNIGIDYLIETYVLKQHLDPSSIYIATLDDDDTWMPDYLNACYEAISPSVDFVVTGLIYHSDKHIEHLSIPKDLSIHSFLQGNPHIQGSNTFVRMSILLQAGCFDESMPSTTDRDIFVRIMQQAPHYCIIPQHLVHIYTEGNRITTNREKKIVGLQRFYRKYQKLMSNDDKSRFFSRNQRYFNILPEDLNIPHLDKTSEHPLKFVNKKTYNGRILIGIIVTYEEGTKRLIEEIQTNVGGDYSIILLNNIGRDLDWLSSLPEHISSRIQVISSKQIKGSIAENRQQLQEYIYNLWNTSNTICWMLDDDMQLKQIGADYYEHQLNIREEILHYEGKYDAVVGGYTNDAPLPLLSTLRLALLDYCYSRQQEPNDEGLWIKQVEDYYYALTDSGYTHLEAPVCEPSFTLDDAFRGKMTRPLVNHLTTIAEAKNRGGNTLIFNRELLLLPTCSLQIRDITARRGDYLWILCAKQENYRVCQGTFCTFHNREKKPFDYTQEMRKIFCDIVGSSMTKAMEHIGLSIQDMRGEKNIIHVYLQELHKRLTRFIENYYRIIGLLQVIGAPANHYQADFSIDNLNYFLRKLEEYHHPEPLQTAFRELDRKIHLAKQYCRQNKYRKLLSRHLNVNENELTLLGHGSEGCVYEWNNRVYKVLYDPKIDLSNLVRFAPALAACPLLYSLTFEQEDGYTILSYPYEQSQPLYSVNASNLSQLIVYGKENGFILTNLKPNNFIQTEHGIKYIDYGKDIIPFSEPNYQRCIERAFQIFRYYFLTDLEFKEIIARSYNHSADAINSGLDKFQQMLIPTYKEQIHDPKIIQTIKQLRPKYMLDYGAGKCKIANQLVDTVDNVDVFDINTSILKKRAVSNIHIIENENDILQNAYDLVNCNQVLCWIDDQQAHAVLHNISNALKKDAYFIMSICNPFFNDIHHTMLRGQGRVASYYNAHSFQEYTSTGKPIDGLEYHRPVDWYIHQLNRFGFQIIDTWETDGIDTDTALPIGEHLVFVCKKVVEYQVLTDTSLMIKVCAMDHNYVYDNIRHIVSQLENGCMFAEKVVCVDLPRTEANISISRQRVYEDDNYTHLINELQRAKHNGWIDRIILPDIQDIPTVYMHYFHISAQNAHAQNGQPLFATLYGFQQIHTPYVYQTDCDILYKVQPSSIIELYHQFTKTPILTIAPSIYHSSAVPDTEGRRVEVRACFLNLSLLERLLPLPNQIEGEYFVLPWHRCLDERIKNTPQLSIRSGNPSLAFVHPTNENKKNPNLISSVKYALETSFLPSCQDGHVDLQGDRYDWIPKTKAPIVIISRGKNTPNEKVKRMLDSIAVQDRTFDLIYTDAHSSNSSEQYVSFLFRYHPKFNHTIYIPNHTDMVEIELLIGAVRNICNPNALIVLVDNDDFLLRTDALSILWEQFQKGHDYICGNCIRYDKPNKTYSVSSFDSLWSRNGDNIWLHPISFRKELFDMIDKKDMQVDGEFINICTDFAYAVPLIQVANSPVYQPIPIYYFEPSIANQRKEGKYKQQIVNKTREIILKKAKERYETNCSRYRR